MMFVFRLGCYAFWDAGYGIYNYLLVVFEALLAHSSLLIQKDN